MGERGQSGGAQRSPPSSQCCSGHTAPGSLLKFPLSPQGDPASCSCPALQSACGWGGRPQTLPAALRGSELGQWPGRRGPPTSAPPSQATVQHHCRPSLSPQGPTSHSRLLGRAPPGRLEGGGSVPTSAAPASPAAAPSLRSCKRQWGWGLSDGIPGPRPVLAPGQRANFPADPCSPKFLLIH